MMGRQALLNALQGIPLELQGGGTQRRTFSYVKDVADGIILALRSPKSDGEAFNICGGEDHSIKELADIIKSLIPNTVVKSTGARAVDAKRGSMDISKAKRTLGYAPRYSLERGIKEYIEWVIKIYSPAFGLKIKNMPVTGGG